MKNASALTTDLIRYLGLFTQLYTATRMSPEIRQEGLAVASIARDIVVEMTPPRDDNAR